MVYAILLPLKNHDDDKTIILRNYQLVQALTVAMDDLGKFEAVLYGLMDLGINGVEQVNFTSSELRKYRDEARLAAIKAAQEKARLLTGAVGITLGKIVNIHEDSVGYSPRSNMSQNVYQNSGSAAEEGLAAGMISIKAGVTLDYELE